MSFLWTSFGQIPILSPPDLIAGSIIFSSFSFFKKKIGRWSWLSDIISILQTERYFQVKEVSQQLAWRRDPWVWVNCHWRNGWLAKVIRWEIEPESQFRSLLWQKMKKMIKKVSKAKCSFRKEKFMKSYDRFAWGKWLDWMIDIYIYFDQDLKARIFIKIR